MADTETPENTKKRKQDGLDSTKSNSTGEGACATEDSPSKIAKLGDPLVTSDSSNDGYSCESSHSSPDNSQELTDNSLKNSDSVDQHVKRNLAPFLVTSSPQQQGAMSSLKEERGVLDLDQNYVFKKLLESFSQETLPEKITYNGVKYNLTAAYDEFWRKFYNTKKYSEGYGLKIPHIGLTDLELKSVVAILKRGWQDERYWPKKLAQPFLASCLFGELDINSTLITPNVFLKFIEPSEKALIKNQNTVDQSVLDIFKKYCSKSTISIGDDIMKSCKRAAYEIMVINMKTVINIWSNELFHMLPESTFNSVMKNLPGYFEDNLHHIREVDMRGFTAPHKLWNTFFRGWNNDQVTYYFQMLENYRFPLDCNLCGDSRFDAKHFLQKCDNLLKTLYVDRHDGILKILLSQLCLAVERRGPYFSKGDIWKTLTLHRNVPFKWPAVMSSLYRLDPKKYPHIIVYSVTPARRALIIEYTISWEFWMDVEKKKKTTKYRIVKQLLEQKGFEVEYRVFVLGGRGVLIPDLYNLLEQIFGMKHSEISKVLEEISVKTHSVPYESKYYKKLMEVLE